MSSMLQVRYTRTLAHWTWCAAVGDVKISCWWPQARTQWTVGGNVVTTNHVDHVVQCSGWLGSLPCVSSASSYRVWTECASVRVTNVAAAVLEKHVPPFPVGESILLHGFELVVEARVWTMAVMELLQSSRDVMKASTSCIVTSAPTRQRIWRRRRRW